MEELHHPTQPPTGTLVPSGGGFRLTQVQPPPMASGCAFFFPGGSLRHRGAPAADCGHRRQRSNGVAGGRGCGLPGLQCLPFLHQTLSSLFLLLFISSSLYPLSYSSSGAFQVLLGTTIVDQGHAFPPLPPFSELRSSPLGYHYSGPRTRMNKGAF